jgi:predicted dehydrogenase
MASTRKIRVASVGLGFGSEFIPIYQAHPNAEMYAVCRRNERELHACGDKPPGNLLRDGLIQQA